MSYSAGLIADYWRDACVVGQCCLCLKRSGLGRCQKSDEGCRGRCDCEGGGTGSLAHKCVCVVLEEVTWQDRAGRQASKCVNSSRNKLGSRDCGKRASLQRALRFASLGHRPIEIGLCSFQCVENPSTSRTALYTFGTTTIRYVTDSGLCVCEPKHAQPSSE